nr:EEIG1/EHBP1 N-terminal domain-containing protein [Tanacetum cinerariifolium]
HLDVESHIVGNHIFHSFEKGVLGIDYDSMAALGMWFHRMAVMDIGYNFGNCNHRINFGGCGLSIRGGITGCIWLGNSHSCISPRKCIDSAKVVEDVVEDDDFNSGAWVSTTNYMIANSGSVTGCLEDIEKFLKKEKLGEVVAIVKSCSPNLLGDLTMTMKYLSSTIPGTVHHKVIGERGYGNVITVGAALILANVSVFSPKPLMHYLNITMTNVVKVFRKDTVPESSSG